MNRSVPSAEAYELTPIQQGMLFHALKESGTGIDIEQIVMELREPLDLAAFVHAWTAVVRQHPILRTSFRWEDLAEPRQEVVTAAELPIARVDWSDQPPAVCATLFAETLQADRLRDFDLADAPPMRLFIARLAPDRFRALWTFHHILLDGRSFPIVLRQLFAAYAARVAGEPIEFPAALPFRRYVEWRRTQDFSQSESFWRESLKGFRAATPFQVDQARDGAEEASRFGFDARQRRLSATATERLRDSAQAFDVTVNTLLQAAWAVLLHRYSGEHDIVFGATRAGRGFDAGAAQMVGLFINTLPLRVRVEDERDLASWLRALRDSQRDVRPHEHISLATVQSLSELPRGSPLFESVVVYEHRSLDAQLHALGGEWANRRFEYIGQTNFPLSVIAYGDDEMLVRLEYSRARFADATIERMLDHLFSLLIHLASATAERVGDLQMLTSAERRELLSEGVALPRYEVSGSLHERFGEQAKRRAHEVALIAFDSEERRIELTYAELEARAERVAQVLRASGVRSGELIGLRTERNLELVVGLLGILKAGGAYLPLDPVYPLDRVRFMLGDAGVKRVLTQRSLAKDLEPFDVTAWCLDEPAQWSAAVDAPRLSSSPDDLAYVIYTSGSTGQPKGVGISHRNVLRLFAATEPWFGFDERDVWTLFHSYAFDFSVWELWGALLYGGRLLIVPQDLSRNPQAFRELLVRERVTVLNQTPTAFRQLIDADRASPPADFALKHIVFGGEALELKSLTPWIERYGDAAPRLINMYGITETTVHVTYRPITRADVSAGRGSVIGEPIPDLRLYLLDQTGQPVPTGVPGEMFVAGAGLAPKGYLNRPELSAQRFVPNPFLPDPAARMYRSGDLARRLPSGELEYLGRIDSQVKIRGFRIELGEIEALIAQEPGVRQAAVIDREDTPGQKRLAAYLVVDDQNPALIERLRERLRRALPDYMVPAHFLFLDVLPLTPNGKLDRRALPVPETTRIDKPFVPPRNDVERTIAEVWQAVLRVERVGIDDHFFELGGDSILSIQIIARCRQAGLRVTPKDLFKHPTIAQLAAVVTAVETAQNTGAVSGRVALTPIQYWFFEQNFAHAHHWNQAFLFEVAADFDSDAFEKAVRRVSSSHDALRLRFARGEHEVIQSYADDGRVTVERIDLSNVETARRAGAITERAARAQGGFDPERGPLASAVHFFLGANVPGRVLLAIHHLVVDGVSWRILREDLESAYLSIKSGTPYAPHKTNSMQQWGKRLAEFAQSSKVRASMPHWRTVSAVPATVIPTDTHGPSSELKSVVRSLSPAETQALLQQVPRIFRTQINDVLLTALLQALKSRVDGNAFRIDLEGHGREHIDDDLDVSRTVGWFTTLFPIAIQLPDSDPVRSLLAVRDQLRKVPMRGMSYGLLRYLSQDAGVRQALSAAAPSAIVFNYLGQFDAVVNDSRLFSFAPESTGPWRHPAAHRAHALEVIAVSRDGSLEVQWQYDASRHASATIEALAETMMAGLRSSIELATRSVQAPLTPGDFPLAEISANALEKVSARYPLEDIYALTPMQQLFFAMESAQSKLGLEQWRFRIDGELDPGRLRRAAEFVVARHSILRTAFIDAGDGVPLQVVCNRVTLPWVEHDWRALTPSDRQAAMAALQAESAQDFDLARPPAARFTLCRTGEREWLLLWSTHHLCIDGWSWPIVFRDLSRAYAAFSAGAEPSLEATLPYRAYVEWLAQSAPDSERFWREELASISAPTPLRLSATTKDAAEIELVAEIDEAASERLQSLAREQQVTTSVLINAAWALALSHYSGSETVVLGAAFSGRPAEMPGVGTMVGPCVNNLPVRAEVRDSITLTDFLRTMQQRQFSLAQNQYTPLEQIQRWSSVPLRHRLFDSLIVFQNYQIDADARRIGPNAELTLLEAPEATNYPLTLAVSAGRKIRIRLLRQPDLLAHEDVRRFAADLVAILERMALQPQTTLGDLRGVLAPELRGKATHKSESKPAANAPFAAPASDIERLIARVWGELFGVAHLSLDDNFFELGGHSILLVRAHAQLRAEMNIELPIVALLQYPTIRSLARHLSAGSSSAATADTAMDRARKQREAQAKLRALTGRR